MGRQKVDTGGTSWQDIVEAIPAWEEEHGVYVTWEFHVEPALNSGAYVECVLHERTVAGKGAELVRVREPMPARKGSGHAGAFLYVAFRALQELEANAWLWPARKRRAVVQEP